MSRQKYLLPDGHVLRYTFNERLIHWLTGGAYLYLLLSGLAFWSPWLFWIAVLLGGPTIARELHPWFGVVFFIGTLLMYQMWSGQMRETATDRKWWGAVGHYIRNEDDQVPPVDRFNAGQKLLFWGFLIFGILLLVTGLVLWFPQYIPWNLRILRLISVFLHPVCALFTIALFIIHVYMGTAMERGAFRSIMRGYVSRAWANHHHRIWYEKILRDEAEPSRQSTSPTGAGD